MMSIKILKSAFISQSFSEWSTFRFFRLLAMLNHIYYMYVNFRCHKEMSINTQTHTHTHTHTHTLTHTRTHTHRYIYIYIYMYCIYVLYMYNMYYIRNKMTLFSKWTIFCSFSKPSMFNLKLIQFYCDYRERY